MQKIPCEEVREEFIRSVTTNKHTEIAKLIRNSDSLLDATLNKDEEALENYGGDILLVGINYNEKSKKHTCRIEEYKK